jgi:hypothetical protein
MQQAFIHHVFFWLKDPSSQQDLLELIEGLLKLSKVSTIKSFHIGKPAATNRSVIDTTYAVSWLIAFETAAGQDSYQVDPIHLNFIKECSELWSKVVVYDAVSI